MDLHYFTENYRYSLTPNGWSVLPYYQFEKNVFENFKNNRWLAIAKGRQMHMTTLLATYAAWLLLTEENCNILYSSPKVETNKMFIDKVKAMIDHYNDVNQLDDDYKKWNSNVIIYGSDNPNQLRVFNSIHSIHSYTSNVVLFDEFALFNENRDLFSAIVATLVTDGQVICGSTPHGTKDQFYDIFVNNRPKFSKQKITWRDNPKYDKEWVEKMRKNLGSELAYREEIEAEFIDHDKYKQNNKKVENKSNLIQFRVNDDMMKQIGYRLIEEDTNISSYIRGLIEKDIKK